jgi:hypothetical protein
MARLRRQPPRIADIVARLASGQAFHPARGGLLYALLRRLEARS